MMKMKMETKIKINHFHSSFNTKTAPSETPPNARHVARNAFPPTLGRSFSTKALRPPKFDRLEGEFVPPKTVEPGQEGWDQW